MYTRVIGLCVCLAPLSLALVGCGDDSGEPSAAEANCTPGEQSKPTGNKATDPCPQNDVMSMCVPFPQFVAVTECCTAVGANCPAAGKWRRSCQCISTAPMLMNMGGAGGANGNPATMTCGDGVVQSFAPRNEKCDPGGNGMPAQIPTTCGALNMGSGMVMCDPKTCQYDTSMCSGANVGAGGAGGS
jgi:hypothetical protein